MPLPIQTCGLNHDVKYLPNQPLSFCEVQVFPEETGIHQINTVPVVGQQSSDTATTFRLTDIVSDQLRASK